jgi:hypothetical protein
MKNFTEMVKKAGPATKWVVSKMRKDDRGDHYFMFWEGKVNSSMKNSMAAFFKKFGSKEYFTDGNTVACDDGTAFCVVKSPTYKSQSKYAFSAMVAK